MFHISKLCTVVLHVSTMATLLVEHSRYFFFIVYSVRCNSVRAQRVTMARLLGQGHSKKKENRGVSLHCTGAEDIGWLADIAAHLSHFMSKEEMENIQPPKRKFEKKLC